MIKQFGGKISPELIERYSQSSQWQEGKFMNLEHTEMDFSFQDLPQMLYKQFFDKEGREPKQPLPVVPFDQAAFLADADQAKFIWYGHSVVLMRLAGQTILIDPMLGPDASPIAPFTTKRFSGDTLDLIGSFPQIDLLIMTHDHYDHLDLDSLERLIPKVKHYCVALGVGRHLEKWGVPAQHITECDWWDQQVFGRTTVTFTPTRHFSGRGLTDRAKSLWGGWAFQTEQESLWFSGDGGYGAHFKEVGARLGPFDFAFMECGQYNEQWHLIHMYPEESVQAALDAGVKAAMPVHWAGFALSQHPWKEPVERFVEAAKAQALPILTPPIGAMFSYGAEAFPAWWADHR
jgi:L-ascorbate metabolism protein UlaG (beta-lactamase superfamily)